MWIRFLYSIYQAGMDINQDLSGEKERIESINRSNKFLKLIDEGGRAYEEIPS